VYIHAYASVSEARACIGKFIDFYNTMRPHSSLDRKTPDQAYFEGCPRHSRSKVAPYAKHGWDISVSEKLLLRPPPGWLKARRCGDGSR